MVMCIEWQIGDHHMYDVQCANQEAKSNCLYRKQTLFAKWSSRSSLEKHMTQKYRRYQALSMRTIQTFEATIPFNRRQT